VTGKVYSFNFNKFSVMDRVVVPAGNRYDFLAGGGEMGHLTRTRNWEDSPLGPIDTWPQALRITLSIILNSKFPMFLWWGEELIQFYNDDYRPSLGNDGKHPQALGQRGADCWPETWREIKPLIDQVMAGGEATWNQDELLPIYRNGRMEDVYWTYSYSPVRDGHGKVAGVLVVCNETTSRVLSLRRAKESEQNLRNVITQAPVAMCILKGTEYVVEIANERMFEVWGVDPDALLGKPIFEGLPQAKDQGFEERLYEVYHAGKTWRESELPAVLPRSGNPELAYLDFVYEPFRDENAVITGIMAVVTDVTEKVTARLKIEEEKEITRLAIAAGEMGVFEVDIPSNEITANERFNDIFGFSHTVSRDRYVAACHPEDREIRDTAIAKSMESGLVDYETRFIHRSGEVRWMKIRGYVTYDEQQQPLKLVGVVQDVTKEKSFAQALALQVEERTLELSRSNEDLLQFAHVASHDLREPVRKARTFNSRLKEEYGTLLPEKGQLYIEKINNSTERMLAMIDGVLTYSTLGDSEQQNALVDLNATITQIMADLEILIQRKQAVITTHGLPVIEGAEVLLYQLFYNLVNNSLKFARENVPSRISITAAEEWIESVLYTKIVVADNGIGIPASYSNDIFNAFKRLNSKDKYEGTGLGLALCKKIVERHFGTIRATGAEHVGAVFTITLPLKQTHKII
jgi:PAS domain S-box-containing protein